MGNKIVVVYKSSTGFTRKYAEMIAQETGGTLADYRKVTKKMLDEYDIIVFGSRAHAGRIDGYKKARELFQKCRADKVALFVTGATPNAASEAIRKFWEQNLGKEEARNIPHFYMQSGLCYEKMNFMDKLMMKGFAHFMGKKKDKTADEKEMGKMLGKSFDYSSKTYIEPLVSLIRAWK